MVEGGPSCDPHQAESLRQAFQIKYFDNKTLHATFYFVQVMPIIKQKQGIEHHLCSHQDPYLAKKLTQICLFFII